ncbi:hypothetical protein BCH_03051 [Brucella sp. 191011898]|nr:hypothetical protein BCH_03051 [Brucella sp. 191011898]
MRLSREGNTFVRQKRGKPTNFDDDCPNLGRVDGCSHMIIVSVLKGVASGLQRVLVLIVGEIQIGDGWGILAALSDEPIIPAAREFAHLSIAKRGRQARFCRP